MVIKHIGQRVGVLIDVANLYHSAKNIYSSRVNFGEVLKLAISKRNLIRVFAYVVKTKTGEEKPFFEALTKLGIETRIKDLQEFYGGAKKADWDVGIVIDANGAQRRCNCSCFRRRRFCFFGGIFKKPREKNGIDCIREVSFGPFKRSGR